MALFDISSLVATALTAFNLLFNFDGTVFPAQATLTNNSSFDYVIVGGGTAGCALAARLVEDKNCTVLVLEAGDNPGLIVMAPGLFFALPQTSVDYDYRSTLDTTAARAHDNHTILTSGKGLGGSSMLNHLLYISDVPETFQKWVNITGDDSWNYTNVLEAMKKSQTLKNSKIAENSSDYHGFEGPIGLSPLFSDSESVTGFLKAQAEVGNPTVVDLNSNTHTGFAQPQYTIASANDKETDTVGGVRQTPAYSYLKRVKDYPNLYVSRNTVVQKIIIEDNTAVGVEATYNGQTYTLNAKKEVILCAGVFNSPKILQLSGIGPEEHLESLGIEVKANLSVGDNLLMPSAVVVVTKTKKHLIPINPADALPLVKPTVLPFPVIEGSVAWNKSSNVPNYQTYNLILPRNLPLLTIACERIYGYKSEVCLNWQKEVSGRDSIMSVVVNLEATSTGTVRLNSTNASDDPLITTGFFSNEEDMTNFITTIKDYTKFVSSPSYTKLGAALVGVDFTECADFEFDTDEYWKCYISERNITPFLYWGTCAMGTVVDTDLKVYEIKNLRVVDASIIPTPMRGAMNAVVLAIAEIAAEKIKAECECSSDAA